MFESKVPTTFCLSNLRIETEQPVQSCSPLAYTRKCWYELYINNMQTVVA